MSPLLILTILATGWIGCSSDDSGEAGLVGGGGSGGSGGGAGGTSSSDDEYVANWTANAAMNMLTFLWDRDGVSGSTNVSIGGPCLLTGTYSAKGTATALANCEGSGKLELSYDLAACEHETGQSGTSVLISGELKLISSSIYAGSCSYPESSYETVTGQGLEVSYVRVGSEPVKRTFTNCSIELNYVGGGQYPSLSGSLCGVPVRIDYAE